MGHRGQGKSRDARRLIANEAARLMASDGSLDFHGAKRKAAQQLGYNDTRGLPSNQEVEEALFEYQRIFFQDSQPHLLQQLRKTAVEAMKMLSDFEPRLVGSVLSGSAGPNSDIQLHLFAAAPERVAIFLMDQKIPYREFTTQLRTNGDKEEFPGLGFMAGEHAIELIIFPDQGLKHPPLSAVDGKPMRRASLSQVEDLLKTA
jgi:hypothetical protein